MGFSSTYFSSFYSLCLLDVKIFLILYSFIIFVTYFKHYFLFILTNPSIFRSSFSVLFSFKLIYFLFYFYLLIFYKLLLSIYRLTCTFIFLSIAFSYKESTILIIFSIQYSLKLLFRFWIMFLGFALFLFLFSFPFLAYYSTKLWFLKELLSLTFYFNLFIIFSSNFLS